jgi:hypothetical protein
VWSKPAGQSAFRANSTTVVLESAQPPFIASFAILRTAVQFSQAGSLFNSLDLAEKMQRQINDEHQGNQ